MIQLEFVGRLHPLVLHLPIGLILALFVIEALALFLRSDARELRICRKTLTVFFALSAVAAASTGYILSLEGQGSGTTVTRHMWSGISVAVLGTALSILTFQRDRAFERHSASVLRILVLVGLGPVIAATGHLGGQLTHGPRFLSAYAPSILQPFLGPSQQAPTQAPAEPAMTVFAGLVQPILNDHCSMCHGPDLQMAQLAVHRPETLMSGGWTGAVIVPGDAQDSELMKRIWLPLQDEGHMPPEGKTQLRLLQISALEWWIGSGARFDSSLDRNTLPQEFQALMAQADNAQETAPEHTAMEEEWDDALLQDLLDKQVSIQRIEQNQPRLWISFPAIASQVTDDTVKELLPLAPYITWLDLSNTGITSHALQWIAQMPALRELNLRQTAIESQALKDLAQLTNLERLNLSLVPVDDSILDTLLDIPSLKRVYLGGTQVSKAGVRRLSAPRVEVIAESAPADVINTEPNEPVTKPAKPEADKT